MPADDPLAAANNALELVTTDPTRARRQAMDAFDVAAVGRHRAAASVALRARGLAEVHLGLLDEATKHLRDSVRTATRADLPELAAQSRTTLAFALIRQGKLTPAVREVTRALGDLGPERRGQGLAQRGAVLQQLGRLDEAAVDYRQALTALRRRDDKVWVQRVLSNRGVLHAFRHEYQMALNDLAEADRLCTELGHTLSAAFVQENLAMVHRRLGDVPTALQDMERAEENYLTCGAPIGSLLLERSELLMSVHLYAEARDAGERAVVESERSGRLFTVPEARLRLSRALVLSGEPQRAVDEAALAVAEFRRQRREEWLALARCMLLLAKLEAHGPNPPRMPDLSRAADAAERAGWPASAMELRLRAGLHGVEVGSRHGLSDNGTRQLELVSVKRHTGPAELRVRGWYAEAVLRCQAGDTRGSARAARRGLRVIESHRRTLAATDLRARVSGMGVDLARIGLRQALRDRKPRRVLDWAELSRARHLADRPALPPDDPQIGQLLAELRAAAAEVEEAQTLGRPIGRLLAQQVALEARIRDVTRNRAVTDSAADSAASLREIGDLLDDAVLVEYVYLDGELHAVCVDDRRATLHHLGGLGPISDELRWLPLELQRLARHGGQPARADRAQQLVAASGQRLAEVLTEPLRRRTGDKDLVVVPTGPLQSLPWSVLPGIRGRPTTLAPSAGLWLRARNTPAHSGPALAVAGPGLACADVEASEVAALYPGGTALVGGSGTIGAFARLARGAALLHLAAHGSVRADNPLFSSIRLSDGPLTVYDLERLDIAADTVVMAACESARDVVLAGDEMLGLSAAFLNRGTRNVVASVVKIPDASTYGVMLALHRELAHGRPVAQALARAQERCDPEDPGALAAAVGFVCLGAGFDPCHVSPRLGV